MVEVKRRKCMEGRKETLDVDDDKDFVLLVFVVDLHVGKCDGFHFRPLGMLGQTEFLSITVRNKDGNFSIMDRGEWNWNDGGRIAQEMAGTDPVDFIRKFSLSNSVMTIFYSGKRIKIVQGEVRMSEMNQEVGTKWTGMSKRYPSYEEGLSRKLVQPFVQKVVQQRDDVLASKLKDGQQGSLHASRIIE